MSKRTLALVIVAVLLAGGVCMKFAWKSESSRRWMLQRSPIWLAELPIDSWNKSPAVFELSNLRWERHGDIWELKGVAELINNTESAIWYLVTDIESIQLGLEVASLEGRQDVTRLDTGTRQYLDGPVTSKLLKVLEPLEKVRLDLRWRLDCKSDTLYPGLYSLENYKVVPGSTIQVRIARFGQLYWLAFIDEESAEFVDLQTLALTPNNTFLTEIYSHWEQIEVPKSQ
jgi:hypothetical protein